jgi:hypothetical protein
MKLTLKINQQTLRYVKLWCLAHPDTVQFGSVPHFCRVSKDRLLQADVTLQKLLPHINDLKKTQC